MTIARPCETCKYLSGVECRRKPPMMNSRTGQPFYPLAASERNRSLRYHTLHGYCEQAGIYWEPIE